MMKPRKTILIVVSLFVLISMMLAACQPAASTGAPAATNPPAAATQAPAATAAPTQVPEPAQVEKLRIAIAKDESTANPYTYVTGYPGWYMMMMQYDTLYQVNAAGEPSPWLATEVKLAEDGLSYDITLRDGVKWHDGTDFTANDVKFAFGYYIEKAIGRFSRDLRLVESVEVTDNTHLVVKMKGPSPSFTWQVLVDVPIIPEHIWKDVVDPKTEVFETNIGTGPYKLLEHKADQYYRFEANDDYFAGQPLVKEIQFIQFSDDAGMIAALQGKEVDIISRSVPPEQVALLGAIQGIKIQSGAEFSTSQLVFDTQTAPFDQIEVRQAIDLAIDKQDLVDTVYLGAATVGNPGYTHPSHPAVNTALAAKYDPEAAKALLEGAGLKDSDGDGVREFEGQPMRYELITPAGNSLRLRMAELIKEMLAVVGIAVDVAAVESTTWENQVWPEFDVAKGRNYQMAMWGWSAATGTDPAQLPNLVNSDVAIGSLNVTGYQSANLDAIGNEVLKTTDAGARNKLIQDLQAGIAEEVPFVTLVYPNGNYAYWAEIYDGWVFVTGQGVLSRLSFLPAASHP
jgi:peptide/nickel transport system substrate-binding protein